MSSSVPANTDVALVLPSLEGGGAERVFLRLARLFTQRGLAVEVVVARWGGSLQRELPASVRLVDLHSGRPSRAIPALVCYLRRTRPRAVLSALTHTNLAVAIAYRLAKVTGRCVLSEHTDVRIALPQQKSLWDWQLIRFLGRKVYPWADAVAAVSCGVAESVIETFRLPDNQVQVIYHPIDALEIQRLGEFPVEFPWHDDLPVVVAVGRLVPEKDYPCLLYAFARLIHHLPCHLAIFGEGKERQNLERLISELGISQDVWLAGFVPNPFPWVARAKLLVLSSQWEGLGGVLLEALCLGVPIVATDCPSGPAEVLEHGRFGTLVPPGDAPKLAEAMAQVLAGGGPKFDREEALARFQPNRVVDQYLNVLGV